MTWKNNVIKPYLDVPFFSFRHVVEYIHKQSQNRQFILKSLTMILKLVATIQHRNLG